MTTQSNQGKVLTLIREHNVIHQTELAQILGIEKSTVSRIVKKLSANGLLQTGGELPASRTGGRKSVLLQLKPEGAHAIGISLDVEKTEIALINLIGQVVCRKAVATPKDKSSKAILAFLSQQVNQFLKRKTVKDVAICGIGIASPGIINNTDGVITSTFCFDAWEQVPVASVLSAATNLPVSIENNVRLEAIAEKCFGVCRDTKSFLCVSAHYGIGLGIFAENKLFRGAHHQAGDLHLSLDGNGPECQCGRKGCIEALAGTKVILEKFRNKGITSIDNICCALNKNDRELEACLIESGEYLGKLVAHLTELFDPEKVVLGGPLIHTGDILFNAVQASFDKHGHKDRWVIEQLEKSALKNDAAIIGAAIMAMDSLFECRY